VKRVTVLLADDHAIVVEGLRRMLEPGFEVIGAVADGLELVKAARNLRPDVIVADVSMPVLSGIEAARQIRAASRRTRIVFLSMHPDVVYVAEAFRAGGSAYVLKSSAGAEIVTAIQQALLQGGVFVSPAIDRTALEDQIRRDQQSPNVPLSLSPRQRAVLQMVAEGQSTKQIAHRLQISPRTVEFHRYCVMRLLGVHTIAELVQYAIKHRLVLPDTRLTTSST
jgi:DNA-binding NarL/FixJ family response regulator